MQHPHESDSNSEEGDSLNSNNQQNSTQPDLSYPQQLGSNQMHLPNIPIHRNVDPTQGFQQNAKTPMFYGHQMMNQPVQFVHPPGPIIPPRLRFDDNGNTRIVPDFGPNQNQSIRIGENSFLIGFVPVVMHDPNYPCSAENFGQGTGKGPAPDGENEYDFSYSPEVPEDLDHHHINATVESGITNAEIPELTAGTDATLGQVVVPIINATATLLTPSPVKSKNIITSSVVSSSVRPGAAIGKLKITEASVKSKTIHKKVTHDYKKIEDNCRESKPQDNQEVVPQAKKTPVVSNPFEFQPVAKNKAFDISKASEKSKLAIETARKQAEYEARFAAHVEKLSPGIPESSEDQQSSSSQKNDEDAGVKEETKPLSNLKKTKKSSKKIKKTIASNTKDEEAFMEAAQYNVNIQLDFYLFFRDSDGDATYRSVAKAIKFPVHLLLVGYAITEFNKETIAKKNSICNEIISHLESSPLEYTVDVAKMKTFYQCVASRNDDVFIADVIAVDRAALEYGEREEKTRYFYFENYFKFTLCIL